MNEPDKHKIRRVTRGSLAAGRIITFDDMSPRQRALAERIEEACIDCEYAGLIEVLCRKLGAELVATFDHYETFARAVWDLTRTIEREGRAFYNPPSQEPPSNVTHIGPLLRIPRSSR